MDIVGVCVCVYTGDRRRTTGPMWGTRGFNNVGRRLCDLLAGTLIKGARCETPRPRARVSVYYACIYILLCVCVLLGAYERTHTQAHTSVYIIHIHTHTLYRYMLIYILNALCVRARALKEKTQYQNRTPTRVRRMMTTIVQQTSYTHAQSRRYIN